MESFKTDYANIGKFIAQKRKELGLTQVELSKKLYVYKSCVQSWEIGKNLPRFDNIEGICRALDVNPLELLTGREMTDTFLKRKIEAFLSGKDGYNDG